MSEHTILFVDDEPGVLRAMRRLFRGQPVRVLTAPDRDAALELLEGHKVQVIVSDQRMPGVSGTSFLREVRERYPRTVRCILSGYAEMDAVMLAINDGNVYRFIAKPWVDDDLVTILKDCLAHADDLDRETRMRESLLQRAVSLQREAAHYAELVEVQETLLRASRDMLEHLPMAVAAIESGNRLIFANRAFSDTFGALLGQAVGEPWRALAMRHVQGAQRIVDDRGVPYSVFTSRVEIAGETHTLLAAAVETAPAASRCAEAADVRV